MTGLWPRSIIQTNPLLLKLLCSWYFFTERGKHTRTPRFWKWCSHFHINLSLSLSDVLVLLHSFLLFQTPFSLLHSVDDSFFILLTEFFISAFPVSSFSMASFSLLTPTLIFYSYFLILFNSLCFGGEFTPKFVFSLNYLNKLIFLLKFCLIWLSSFILEVIIGR